ncbi:MAG: hypothetical protein ACRDQU_04865 [Pseudonocardiaceae bacterium]
MICWRADCGVDDLENIDREPVGLIARVRSDTSVARPAIFASPTHELGSSCGVSSAAKSVQDVMRRSCRVTARRELDSTDVSESGDVGGVEFTTSSVTDGFDRPWDRA